MDYCAGRVFLKRFRADGETENRTETENLRQLIRAA